MSVVESVVSAGDQRTRDRYAALSVLWGMSSLSRQQTCQRVSVREDGSADIVAGGAGDERTSGWSGLASCGSVWTCPACAEKILAGRQVEIEGALEAWKALGHGKVGMVTLTMRHDKSQSLEQLWDALSYAWGAVTSGRPWERAHAEYGSDMPRKITKGKRAGRWVVEPRIGYARLVEVTHGKNGWHVHVHAALFVNNSVDSKRIDELGCEMFTRWQDALERKGLRAPLCRSGGMDAVMWNAATKKLSRYFTKQTFMSTSARAAMELTRSDLKKAKRGNRSPMELLASLVELPDAERCEAVEDLRTWFEWERVSAGRRQMSWSTGLRDFLRLAPEATDEELAAEKQEGFPLLRLGRGALVAVAAKRLGGECKIAARVDDDGASLEALLRENGILFRRTTDEEKREYAEAVQWSIRRREEKRLSYVSKIPEDVRAACLKSPADPLTLF